MARAPRRAVLSARLLRRVLEFVACGLIAVVIALAWHLQDRGADRAPVALQREPTSLGPYNLSAHCRDGYPSPMRGGNQRCCQLADQGAAFDSAADQVVCLPSLVILGAAKAGTTILYALLAQHPAVRIGHVKELAAFVDERKYAAIGRGNFRTAGLLPTLVGDVGRQVTIDATPNYMTVPTGCPRLAFHLSPTARFIALLREPVGRLWSQVMMHYRFNADREAFTAWATSNYAVVKDCSDAHVLQFVACLRGALAPRDFGHAVQELAVALTKHRHCLDDEDAFVGCAGDPLAIIKVGRASASSVLSGTVHRLLNATRSTHARAHRCHLDDCPAGALVGSKLVGGACVGCGCTCFRTGLTASTFQGAYLPQLAHCLQHIPRDRLLVLDHADLQHDAAATMRKVLEFAGLPFFDYSQVSVADAERAFDRAFPSFKADIGWHGHSSAMRMPGELAAQLREMYSHDTPALRALTGLPLPLFP